MDKTSLQIPFLTRTMRFSSVYLILAGAWSAATVSITSQQGADSTIEKRATCTPASLGNTQEDDTPAIAAAIKSCGNGGTIVIPAGTTYSLRSALSFTGCVGCDFQLEGTLKASDDTTYWATQTAVISLNSISGAKFRSLTGSGVIDGNGQDAYDQFAANSSLARATVFYISGGSNIYVGGFSVKNPPNVFFSQKGSVSNVQYASLTMTAASKSTNAPKNTDGFDIGESTYTTINDVYVSNQDDCVAFKSGSNYVTVERITCAGRYQRSISYFCTQRRSSSGANNEAGTNHGLSVGSLAQTNADSVKNVYVNNATMSNCGKAAGIKLYPGGPDYGTATVSNVTWSNIIVDQCEYAVQIQSCYNADADYCAEYPSAADLTGIYLENFSGQTKTQAGTVTSNLNCPAAGTCDLYFTDYSVISSESTSEVLCNNIDSNPGITCVSGASG